MTFGRQKGWIGIELGPRAMKVAQVERTRAGLRVAASVVVPRTRAPRRSADAPAPGCDWTGQDLRAALALKPGFVGRKAACVLPMHLTDLHTLAIPPGTVAEQRAIITNQLSCLFSDDRQEGEFDYWKTEAASTVDPPDSENVNVLSVARKLVFSVADHVSSARLNCEVINGFPFVLARAVSLTEAFGPKALVGAVQWGYTSATFCVASGAGPLFARHLRSSGANRLVDAIRGALGLSEEEAVQTLVSHGLPDANGHHGTPTEIQEAVAEITARPLDEMAEELKKTVSYVQTQYRGIVPDCLCLLGDGAAVKNVGQALSQKVGLPVHVWRLPHSVQEAPDKPEEHPALLGPAVALSTLAWTS